MNPAGAVNLGSAYGEIIIDGSKIEGQITSALNSADRAATNMLSNIGGKLQGIGSNMSLAMAPVTAFVSGGILAFANFDEILTEIEARTGATAEEMEIVRATALQMGQDTAFSSTQAADAMLQLLSSGSSLAETMKMLPDVLNLAAAANIDLGYSADAVTDIMASFGLGVDRVSPRLAEMAERWGLSSTAIEEWLAQSANLSPELELIGSNLAAAAAHSDIGLENLDDLRAYINTYGELPPEIQKAAEEWGVSEEAALQWAASVSESDIAITQLATDLDLTVGEFRDWIGEVENGTSVVNALSAASASSSATVPDLIDGFAKVGNVAKNMGLSVEQTAAVLAVFAENGIKGQEAGTQLRSMLNNMTRDTKDVQAAWATLGTSMYDANGNMRDLDDVIDDIIVGMEGMSDEERNQIIRDLGGNFGQLGLSALLASGGIDTMQEKMDNAASAATIAQARMSSFRGVTNQLKSTLETLSINVIGPLAEDYLQPAIEYTTQLLNKFNEWVVSNEDVAAALGLVLGVLAVIGPIMFTVGSYLVLTAKGFSMLFSVLKLGIPVFKLIGVLLGGMSLPIWGIVAAIAALYAAYRTNFLGFADGVDEIMRRLGESVGAVRGIVESLASAIGGISFPDIAISLPDIGAMFGALLGSISLPDLSGLHETISNAIQGVLDTEFSLDTSTVATKIAGVLGGMSMPRIDFSRIGEMVNTDLLNAIVAMAGIVFGGPVGMVIGAARLVTMAYENDFLGFRTMLEDSGIMGSLKEGADWILDTLAGAFDDFNKGDFVGIGKEIGQAINGGISQVIGGGGGTDVEGGGEGSPETTLADKLRAMQEIIKPIANAVGIDIGTAIVDAIAVGAQLSVGVVYAAGSLCAEWLKLGIDDQWAILKDAAAEGVGIGFKDAFGVFGPDWEELGRTIPTGISLGITKYLPEVESGAQKIVSALTDLLGSLGFDIPIEIDWPDIPDAIRDAAESGVLGAAAKEVISWIPRDTGGLGMPGIPYLIGTGAQPEAFIPQTRGTFIPNFDQILRGIDSLANLLAPSSMNLLGAGAGGGAMGGGVGGGVGDIHLTVNVPPGSNGTEIGHAIADTLEERIMRRYNRQ